MPKGDNRLAGRPNPLSAVLRADAPLRGPVRDEPVVAAPPPLPDSASSSTAAPTVVSSPLPHKEPTKAPPKARPASPPTRRQIPSRLATTMIGGHFPAEAKRQLGLIAVEEDTTKQALLEEALNLLFEAHGKRRIDFERRRGKGER